MTKWPELKPKLPAGCWKHWFGLRWAFEELLVERRTLHEVCARFGISYKWLVELVARNFPEYSLAAIRERVLLEGPLNFDSTQQDRLTPPTSSAYNTGSRRGNALGETNPSTTPTKEIENGTTHRNGQDLPRAD